MNLSAAASPAGAVLSSPQWNIGGSKIKNYTQAVDKAEVTQLPNADMQQNAVGFYFINGSLSGTDITVSFEGKVDGVRAKAKAKLKVFRPQMNSFTSQWTNRTPPVGIRIYNSPAQGLVGGYLQLGDLDVGPSRGITWTAVVTTPANGAGQIAYTQRSDFGRAFLEGNGASTELASHGYVLDDVAGIQYRSALTVGSAVTSEPLVHDDSPGERLNETDEAVSIFERFETYLMYKPSGTDSIWVTLGLLNWSWNGSAGRNTDGVWQLGTGASPQAGGAGPIGANSTQLPTWTDSFSAVKNRGRKPTP